MSEHDGNIPPYIPLPSRTVLFRMGFYGGRCVKWSGRGELPGEVVEYVRENGALPPYDE